MIIYFAAVALTMLASKPSELMFNLILEVNPK